MNKTKKISRLGLLLAALFAVTLTLASCAQKDDGDYFSSSEILTQLKFGEISTNCYKFDTLFENSSFETDEEISGILFIVDSFDYDLWKYMIHYQIDIKGPEEGQSDYRVRRVYVKNKTDALKVYKEICNDGFEKNISADFHTARQFYGIDYDLEALMSDYPVSFKVQNMDGDKFSKSERIEGRPREYQENGVTIKYTQGIYEKRYVTPIIDLKNGLYLEGSFYIMDNGTNEYWPYAVYYFQDFYTLDPETYYYKFQSESYAGVACQTKKDAKKVLKDMLEAFKENPGRFTNMPENYRGWHAYGKADDAPYYDLDKLVDF